MAVRIGQSSVTTDARGSIRQRIEVRGAVQGVGFRPFVYRLAREYGLYGWVQNGPSGVVIEVEGPAESLSRFAHGIRTGKPTNAQIHGIASQTLGTAGYTDFRIRDSAHEGRNTAVILPDIAMCADCRTEITDPHDRRYRYPFTNCTNCGPRFTIVESMPYDRAGTTMKSFVMCAECRREYDDPSNRRFHAQPNACPVCGPRLTYWNSSGDAQAAEDCALRAAADDIREGCIVAIKGLGGFHLIVDARNSDAVLQLRQRKQREEKPLALMYPDLASIRRDCIVSSGEEQLLCSPESPIVLFEKRGRIGIAESVAGPARTLGVMLPYTPLHYLLLSDLGFPVVATSGNLSDEPICIDEDEARTRLSGIADSFLVHDRPIERHVDDSVVRIVAGRPMLLRRARGYAPLPVGRPGGTEHEPVILAVGAHLKNTLAVSAEAGITVSQHIGDLETVEAHKAFVKVARDLPQLLDATPERIVCDRHPDYHATIWAKRQQLPVMDVQHHHAHIVSCMEDNYIDGDVLGVAWDGTGFGDNGTVWGGEFLACSRESYRRIGHLRTFSLPGGDAAAREPRRSALGVLYALFGEAAFDATDWAPIAAFSDAERVVLRKALRRSINAPRTSSVGRVFDAVASILKMRQVAAFEGQAPMLVEYAASESDSSDIYEYGVAASDDAPSALVLDWEPIIRGVIADQERELSCATIAAKFHNTLAAALADVASRHAEETGQNRIALSGGCFQNKLLLEKSIDALRAAGLTPFWHHGVPPNDGGICVGQAAVALARWRSELEAGDVPGDSR